LFSPTFYDQLLCAQIPKAQIDTEDLTVSFTLLGSTHVKADCKALVKLTQGVVGSLDDAVLSLRRALTGETYVRITRRGLERNLRSICNTTIENDLI
jgi:hypothetical protein